MGNEKLYQYGSIRNQITPGAKYNQMEPNNLEKLEDFERKLLNKHDVILSEKEKFIIKCISSINYVCLHLKLHIKSCKQAWIYLK